MTWKSVPICRKCWNTEEPDKPVKLHHPEFGSDEICYRCGTPTNSGIYVRREVKGGV